MTDDELYEIMCIIDDLSYEGEFDAIDEIVNRENNLSDPNLSLTMLTSTLAIRSKLKLRDVLLERSKDKWGKDLFIGL